MISNVSRLVMHSFISNWIRKSLVDGTSLNGLPDKIILPKTPKFQRWPPSNNKAPSTLQNCELCASLRSVLIHPSMMRARRLHRFHAQVIVIRSLQETSSKKCKKLVLHLPNKEKETICTPVRPIQEVLEWPSPWLKKLSLGYHQRMKWRTL